MKFDAQMSQTDQVPHSHSRPRNRVSADVPLVGIQKFNMTRIVATEMVDDLAENLPDNLTIPMIMAHACTMIIVEHSSYVYHVLDGNC